MASFKRYIKLQNNLPKTPLFLAGLLIGAGIKELIEDKFQSRNPLAYSNDESSSSFASLTNEKVGLPLPPSKRITYSKHVLYYDNSRRIPSYVLEHLTKDKLTGNSDRSFCHFKPDEKVKDIFRATNEDYLGSGYARGHMVPAGDVKNDQTSMQETFYLSNIVPQDYENNAGFWYRFECYCRSLAKRYENVYIISGPLFLAEKNLDNKKYVRYEVVGENEVAVPTHLYKLILVELSPSSYAIGAFVIPNKLIDSHKKLTHFKVDLRYVEKCSGFEFFPKLERSQLKDLCDYDSCKVITKEMAELYHLSRSIKYAENLEELEKIWYKAQKNKIKLDKKFIDEFNKKKTSLKNNIL